MSVRSGQSVTVEFVTSSFSTGAAANADSTPTGTLVVNGTDNAASVTVTNIDTGRYKAAVTLPTLAIGDVVELIIAATVSSVAGKGVVWRDSKDVLLDSSGKVTDNQQTGDAYARLGAAGAGLTALGDARLTHLDADVSGRAAPGDAMTLDLTQAVATANTANTVGDCLNAARAQGFGKWAIAGTTLTLYAPDGTTAVRTFTLDSAVAPTARA